MKRLFTIKLCIALVMVVMGMAAQSVANTRHAPLTSARAYFIRAYAIVIAGETLAPQCNLLSNWQQLNLDRHANTLRALMAERLPVEDINQAKRIASDLVDRHSNCDTSARAIVDDSLFAAHELVHSRAAGTEPQSVGPDLKEFLAWAKAEIEAHKSKPVVRIVTAPKKRKKPKQQSASFRRFKSTVQAYYVERRCKHLGRRAAKSYWRGIARAHKKAVAKFGAERVSVVQKQAERAAKRKARRCGSKTRAQVMAGYSLIKRRTKAQSFRASLTLKSRSTEGFDRR